MERSIKIMTETFLGKRKRDETVEEIIKMFETISVKREERPKVAIFGDFYVRDNDVMNQDLTHFIENNGGEVIPTFFSSLASTAGPFFADRDILPPFNPFAV